MQGKQKLIAYWVLTGLTVLVIGGGGVVDVLSPPEVVATVQALGYPAYFARMLGVWKVAGAATIALPGLARLKEWAYAGIVIDVTSASIAHAAAGDELGKVIVPIVVLAFALGSWALRPDTRRLPDHRPDDG